MSVLAVVINWRRPDNVKRVVAELRKQVDKTVVFDNANTSVNFGADSTWRLDENLGCPCRYAPALMDHSHEYVLFHDDDILPRPNYVAVLKTTMPKHGIVGYFGRRLQGGRYAYGQQVGRVDLAIRSYMIRRVDLWHVLSFREALIHNGAGPLVDVHDDIMVNCAMQVSTGKDSYVIDQRWYDELPSPHGVCQRPGHAVERQRMIDHARQCGWR